jgi:hypothetical protein
MDAVFENMTPFQMIFSTCVPGFESTTRYKRSLHMVALADVFLHKGQNPNVDVTVYDEHADIITCKPLHIGHSVELVKALLAHGAKVNARDSRGKTPLDSVLGMSWYFANYGKVVSPPHDAYEAALLLLRRGGCITESGREDLQAFITMIKGYCDVDPKLMNPPPLRDMKWFLDVRNYPSLADVLQLAYGKREN